MTKKNLAIWSISVTEGLGGRCWRHCRFPINQFLGMEDVSVTWYDTAGFPLNQFLGNGKHIICLVGVAIMRFKGMILLIYMRG